jgi:hypothetical protein
MKKLFALLISLSSIGAVSSTAEAASGAVMGRLRYLQRQGNFCPTTRDCTGARYLQAEFNTEQGIGFVDWQLINSSNKILAQGQTGPDGDFLGTWSSSGSLSGARIRFFLQRWDPQVFRFRVHNLTSNQPITLLTSTFTLENLSPGLVQDLGDRRFGLSPGSNQNYLNVLNGAMRMWNDSLSTAPQK